MADNKNKQTIFQSLGKALISGFDKEKESYEKKIHSYNIDNNHVIYKTDNKEDADNKKLQLKQDKYLAAQWYGASKNLSMGTALSSNQLKLMYRDVDIMDNFPEVGAALDLFMEESCTSNNKGQILNIVSPSKRVKMILEDLFVNRLDIHINLPMWTRAMCKYGNAYALLNIKEGSGVVGARMLPVYEMERIEDGQYSPYIVLPNDYNKSQETEFVWVGQNTGTPFKNWQVAHFRLLNDSLLLPYGVSVLQKGRRHFRILSMMEDMMLIYRLERSIERRVFKIYVGNLDDADIPAYVQEIANTFKRTPIVDPETGQLDLRKTSLDVSQDIFIPVKTEGAANPIDTLQAASNIDKIEDLKFIQNKLFTALRVPKEFLNFEEASGDGKNLALKDIRFTRTINRIQQALIMELNKIAMIHLYLNGFEDELTNFKITMNNPSTQSQILMLEELSKKIQIVNAAVQDPGNGIQIMSLSRAQREILGWSEEEITQNILEIRMEKALAAELLKTEQIIKRTGLFDKIDDMYGEPNAEYASSSDFDEEGDKGGGGIGGMGGGIGNIGSDMEIPEQGEEPSLEGVGQEQQPGQMEQPENTEELPETPKLESILKKTEKLLLESKKLEKQRIKGINEKYMTRYINYILESKKDHSESFDEIVPIYNKSIIKNGETNLLIEQLEKKIKVENLKSDDTPKMID